MGRLTTHVLDTARGLPAAGLAIELYRLEKLGQAAPQRLLSTTTNNDGRCDAPLLEGDSFGRGRYRLIFKAGDYLRACGMTLPEFPFLDDVVIDFGIDDPGQHFHVPLLLSAYGYSTYRGS
ncbi:MAG: hydroxyisourate hydrolase [Candidatus Puniceispirillum sp.]